MADITVCGRLTKDPETRQVRDKTLAKFALADSDYFRKTKEGERQTIFFDCEVWGREAETIDNYCRKGSRIKVAGQLTPNWWTNKSGEIVRANLLKVDRVMLLDPKDSSGSKGGENLFDSVGSTSAMASKASGGNLYGDEIPF